MFVGNGLSIFGNDVDVGKRLKNVGLGKWPKIWEMAYVRFKYVGNEVYIWEMAQFF